MELIWADKIEVKLGIIDLTQYNLSKPIHRLYWLMQDFVNSRSNRQPALLFILALFELPRAE
jgi:hypothetical protein